MLRKKCEEATSRRRYWCL